MFIGLFNGQMDSANFSSAILPGILPLPLVLDADFGQQGAGGSVSFNDINTQYDHAAGTWRLHTPFFDLRGGTRP